MKMLEKKVALVVGTSSGIGYGTALRFAKEGATVIASARRLEKLEELKKDALERGFEGEIVPYKCDIMVEAELDAMVKFAIDNYGRIDILACIAQNGMLDQRFTMDVNAENAHLFFDGGPLYTLQLIQKCMPYFEKQHFGRIITCASGAGVGSTPGFTSYSMAKAATIALTRICAKEFAKFGVTTNCFLPIAMADSFSTSDQSAEALEFLKSTIPVGYVGLPFEDISPMLAFLASDDAKYVNGQFIGLDGGCVELV
ncbi:MAG: SDR family oxidoreductase [Firmicutes bacterium]|nr:SDR family oxidoreductase [Bacillota bacterium]